MSWEALNVAATDRRSGSANIAANAARALVEIAATLSSDAIVDAARVLVTGQPIMAACIRLADMVLRGLEEAGAPGARRAAEEFSSRFALEKAMVTEHLRAKLPREGIVLTVSASSTVLDALRDAGHLRVVCALSEPGGEGKTAVEYLTAHGVEASVIPDGAIAKQSTVADMIVFGADAIGPEALLNKSGTLAAVLGARSNARACIAVAGTTKLVDAETFPKLAAAAERLRVEGVHAFEEVPGSLLTTFVTESGPLSQRALRKASRTLRLHPQVTEWLG